MSQSEVRVLWIKDLVTASSHSHTGRYKQGPSHIFHKGTHLLQRGSYLWDNHFLKVAPPIDTVNASHWYKSRDLRHKHSRCFYPIWTLSYDFTEISHPLFQKEGFRTSNGIPRFSLGSTCHSAFLSLLPPWKRQQSDPSLCLPSHLLALEPQLAGVFLPRVAPALGRTFQQLETSAFIFVVLIGFTTLVVPSNKHASEGISSSF